MKLTTGVLTIDGRWCSRLHLAEMLATGLSPQARTKLIYIPRLPQGMPDGIVQLAQQVQTPLQARVRQAWPIAGGRAALYVTMWFDASVADRATLLVRIAKRCSKEVAEKIAGYLNLDDVKNVVLTNKATYSLLQIPKQ